MNRRAGGTNWGTGDWGAIVPLVLTRAGSGRLTDLRATPRPPVPAKGTDSASCGAPQRMLAARTGRLCLPPQAVGSTTTGGSRGVSDPPPERETWPHPRAGGGRSRPIVAVAVLAMRRPDPGQNIDANQAQLSLDSVPGSRQTQGPAVNRRDDKVWFLALHRSWPTAAAATTHRAARRQVRVEPDHHAVDDGLDLVPVKARRWAPTTPGGVARGLDGILDRAEGRHLRDGPGNYGPHAGPLVGHNVCTGRLSYPRRA